MSKEESDEAPATPPPVALTNRRPKPSNEKPKGAADGDAAEIERAIPPFWSRSNTSIRLVAFSVTTSCFPLGERATWAGLT